MVDQAITGNATITEIENVLFGFCDILHGMEVECREFVEGNLERVIDLLVNEYLAPDVICEMISLCP